MKIVTHECDIIGCSRDCTNNKGCIGLQVTAIWTTEQEEGHPCPPYLGLETVDLCLQHQKLLMEGNMIFARGAIGYNEYYFKTKDEN